jgi:hypothetical protein
MSRELRAPVYTLNVSLLCDCGGSMVFEGRVLTSNPPQYPHTCDQCGKSERAKKKYPCIEYEFGTMPGCFPIGATEPKGTG